MVEHNPRVSQFTASFFVLAKQRRGINLREQSVGSWCLMVPDEGVHFSLQFLALVGRGIPCVFSCMTLCNKSSRTARIVGLLFNQANASQKGTCSDIHCFLSGRNCSPGDLNDITQWDVQPGSQPGRLLSSRSLTVSLPLFLLSP